jgi:hypothetical protein
MADDDPNETHTPRQAGDDYDVMLVMPETEARAFAKLLGRIDYDACCRFAAVCVTYGNRAECDVMWSAICLLQRQLSEAGFAPR